MFHLFPYKHKSIEVLSVYVALCLNKAYASEVAFPPCRSYNVKLCSLLRLLRNTRLQLDKDHDVKRLFLPHCTTMDRTIDVEDTCRSKRPDQHRASLDIQVMHSRCTWFSERD